MKRKISFLALAAIALDANCVCASECIGEDCELTTIEETAEVLQPIKSEFELSCEAEETTCTNYDYYCPFDSEIECAIWYKKPAYKTTVAPRAPHINSMRVDDMLYEIYFNQDISANDSVMSPLVSRYTMLMNASSACCTAGIIYKMRENGADDAAVYQFLKDDANDFGITKNCLTMDNDEIEHRYSNGVTGEMVLDVRNACLCKNHQWFDSLLQPFVDIYERAPAFQDNDFTYTYIDGLNREVCVSVNGAVQTTLGLLGACPK